MNTDTDVVPVILALSGHDPTGAAGIQADMESIHENGGRCISVITALTAQNTTCFEEILPQDPVNFRKQVDLLTADIPINACKVGLIGSSRLVSVIAQLAETMANIPWIVDPVLQSGTGTDLADADIIDALFTRLFPRTTMLTPNLGEARKLTGLTDSDAAAGLLLETGCQNVLITDTRPNTATVTNVLYSHNGRPKSMKWDRLPGTYHGSGCTLSSAIAACLAQGMDTVSAVEKAQTFTWRALQRGEKIGKGQIHPQRLI